MTSGNAVRSVRFPAHVSRRCHNPVESGPARLQRVVLGVGLKAHRQGRVTMPDPGCDHRYRHPKQVDQHNPPCNIPKWVTRHLSERHLRFHPLESNVLLD